MRKTGIVWLLGLFASFAAIPHGGGLDSNGGHFDRKTGNYHCHRAPCGSGASATVRSVTPAKQSPSATKPSEPLTVASLPVYNRKDWNHWIDADGDCINTRHEILIAHADGAINRSPDGCYVSTGTWIDPYSGKTFHRTSEIDIDHVIPLKWAHDHGGFVWSSQAKELFANDEENLLAVSQSLNKEKGAQGPDQWLPPNQSYRCEYLQLWQRLLLRYPTLNMTSAEQRVFQRQLLVCKQS